MQPLLEVFNRDSNSIVLHSAQPCTVPHIVITEALPQDPWEALVNNTVNPQDCGFGCYLTVPSALVDTINTELHLSHAHDDPYFTSCDVNESEVPLAPDSESGSDDDSPVLLTPPSHLSLLDDDVRTSVDSCYPPISSDFRLYDDEDDDDLPPFDDWYLDIAQRASLSC